MITAPENPLVAPPAMLAAPGLWPAFVAATYKIAHSKQPPRHPGMCWHEHRAWIVRWLQERTAVKGRDAAHAVFISPVFRVAHKIGWHWLPIGSDSKGGPGLWFQRVSVPRSAGAKKAPPPLRVPLDRPIEELAADPLSSVLEIADTPWTEQEPSRYLPLIDADGSGSSPEERLASAVACVERVGAALIELGLRPWRDDGSEWDFYATISGGKGARLFLRWLTPLGRCLGRAWKEWLLTAVGKDPVIDWSLPTFSDEQCSRLTGLHNVGRWMVPLRWLEVASCTRERAAVILERARGASGRALVCATAAELLPVVDEPPDGPAKQLLLALRARAEQIADEELVNTERARQQQAEAESRRTASAATRPASGLPDETDNSKIRWREAMDWALDWALDEVKNGKNRHDAGFDLACQLRDHEVPFEEARLCARDYYEAVPKDRPRQIYVDEFVGMVDEIYEEARLDPSKKREPLLQFTDPGITSVRGVAIGGARATPAAAPEPASAVFFAPAGEVRRLTAELVSSAPFDGCWLIVAPPGAGKSHAAKLRALAEARAGRRVLIFVLNRVAQREVLADLCKLGGDDLPPIILLESRRPAKENRRGEITEPATCDLAARCRIVGDRDLSPRGLVCSRCPRRPLLSGGDGDKPIMCRPPARRVDGSWGTDWWAIGEWLGCEAGKSVANMMTWPEVCSSQASWLDAEAAPRGAIVIATHDMAANRFAVGQEVPFPIDLKIVDEDVWHALPRPSLIRGHESLESLVQVVSELASGTRVVRTDSLPMRVAERESKLGADATKKQREQIKVWKWFLKAAQALQDVLVRLERLSLAEVAPTISKKTCTRDAFTIVLAGKEAWELLDRHSPLDQQTPLGRTMRTTELRTALVALGALEAPMSEWLPPEGAVTSDADAMRLIDRAPVRVIEALVRLARGKQHLGLSVWLHQDSSAPTLTPIVYLVSNRRIDLSGTAIILDGTADEDIARRLFGREDLEVRRTPQVSLGETRVLWDDRPWSRRTSREHPGGPAALLHERVADPKLLAQADGRGVVFGFKPDAEALQEEAETWPAPSEITHYHGSHVRATNRYADCGWAVLAGTPRQPLADLAVKVSALFMGDRDEPFDWSWKNGQPADPRLRRVHQLQWENEMTQTAARLRAGFAERETPKTIVVLGDQLPPALRTGHLEFVSPNGRKRQLRQQALPAALKLARDVGAWLGQAMARYILQQLRPGSEPTGRPVRTLHELVRQELQRTGWGRRSTGSPPRAFWGPAGDEAERAASDWIAAHLPDFTEE